MTACASVAQLGTKTHEQTCQGIADIGCAGGNLVLGPEGGELVVGAVLEDVEEDAWGQEHASDEGEFGGEIVYVLWDGTFLPEENGVDHAAHAGDLPFEAVVEGGGES